jgi:hypothetical protein
MNERLYFCVGAQQLKTMEEALQEAEKFSSYRDQVILKAERVVKAKGTDNPALENLIRN